MSFHHTRIDLLGATHRQHMLELRLASDALKIDPITRRVFTGFHHLAIRQPLGPPNHGETWAAFATRLRSWIPTTTGLQDGGLISLGAVRENRGQMPRSQATVSVIHQLVGLGFATFAHHSGPHQLGVSRDRGMIPKVTHVIALIRGTVFLLFLTQAHCSSHSKARGVRSRTG